MKRGQVWIETVLYTLIGLSLIALALVFIAPRISQTQDRLAIEQTIDSLNELDSRMNIGPGNIRHIDFTMKRGQLIINSPNDTIIYIIEDIESPYSEPGVEIDQGRIKILTEETQNDYIIILSMDYSRIFDLRYGGQNVRREFTAAPTPYKFSIESKSSGGGGDIIDIKEISS